MEREVLAVLDREPLEERLELGDAAEPREQRALLVLLVASHRAREERGDVADGIHVRRRSSRFSSGPRQVLEAFLESPMGSFELNERIARFFRHWFSMERRLACGRQHCPPVRR